jgi:hypothetical protein
LHPCAGGPSPRTFRVPPAALMMLGARLCSYPVAAAERVLSSAAAGIALNVGAFAAIALILIVLLVLGAFAIGGAGVIILLALIGLAAVVGTIAYFVSRGRSRKLPAHPEALLPTDERGTSRPITGPSEVP